MVDPIIKINGLRKVYLPSPGWMRLLIRTSVTEPVIALDDVSIEVRPGEICAVVGPNGAGKSTMFRVLTGLTTPTSGSATILDRDTTDRSHDLLRSIGFSPAEHRTIWLRHTCRENLVFHARLQGIPKKDTARRVDNMLERVGLGHAAERVGFALSSGMQARLMLARALLHEPRVLILDEPTGSVDPVGSYELLEIIKKLTIENQLAVLISSHRLDEIEALHDSVLLLDRGKEVYRGDLDSLRGEWERPQIEIGFSGEKEAMAATDVLRATKGVEVKFTEGSRVTVSTAMPMGQLLTVLNGRVGDIHTVNQTKIRLQELLATMLHREGDNQL